MTTENNMVPEDNMNIEQEEPSEIENVENVEKADYNELQATLNTSKDPMIQKFIEFVNTYSKIDKIDDKVIKIVNTAFRKISDKKTSNNSKIDLNIPEDKDLYIKDSDMKEFCKTNMNDNSMIPITINDPKLTEYMTIYKNMKNMYIDNCEFLFRVLENRILNRTPVDEKDETPHFTIKNIGYGDLVEIETEVRDKLVTMYSKCHEEYQKGIVALYKSLNTESTA